MSRENDQLVLLCLFDYVPRFSSGDRIHTGGRLIQQNYLSIPNQGNTKLQLPFLPTRQTSDYSIFLMLQVELVQVILDSFFDSVRVDALELAEEVEVLMSGQLL